ncbi:DegT/DnrJ/EryC1/StrS family aminotransferase [bacterium]|nr:DegT/DnrJ/EryC1/StrS family aminotransferase [bacterium]
MSNNTSIKVPFFRVELGEDEINEVTAALRSGWVTTGPRTKQFEAEFAEKLGVSNAIALNSATAALHLALEAIGIQRGDLVIVPTMTFAATAEVVRYFDAIPVFVDCGADLNIDPDKLEATLSALEKNKPVAGLKPPYERIHAMIPMHYGGYCCEMNRIREIAKRFDVIVIEDAAHALLSKYRPDGNSEWENAGCMSEIGAFSFYANKCITTGEGGMGITNNQKYADRMRLMALHGMDRDAWKRFTDEGSWYYEIVAPGYKYNLTDIASSIGIHQLRKVEELRNKRYEIAQRYNEHFNKLNEVEIPPNDESTRIHSWHLYPLRLNLDKLSIDRASFIDELRDRGVGCSVHWMPLHMNPYYVKTYGYTADLFPVAEKEWQRLISLPIFPGQTAEEVAHVCAMVEEVSNTFRK